MGSRGGELLPIAHCLLPAREARLGRLRLLRLLLFDDAHDVGLLHDQEFFAVDLHFRARPFAEQDAVADLHIEGDALAVFIAGAGADADHFAFLRLLLGRVRNDDAALGLLFFLHALYEHAVVQGTKARHWVLPWLIRPFASRP